MNARSALVGLSLAAILGLSACGGGGSSASGKPQADGTYKKADLAKKADEICTQTKADAKAAKITPVSNAGDPVQVATYLGKLTPIIQNQYTQLAALKPAADVQADYADFVAKEQAVVTFFTKVLAKAKAKDPSGQKDLAAGASIGPAFLASAKKIGSKVCGT